MRKHLIGSCLLLTGALLGYPIERAQAQAGVSKAETSQSSQFPDANIIDVPAGEMQPESTWQAGPPTTSLPYLARGQWDVSGQSSNPSPLPTGPDRPDTGGLYGAVEFLFMHGDRALGHQLIAQRGFYDSDGSVTGTAGTFVGSRATALNTDSLGRTTWVPGMRLTVGYKMEDGLTLSVSYIHLIQAKYTDGAGPIPGNFSTGQRGEDSFLTANVFNFSPQFSGPQNRIGALNAITGQFQPIGSGGSPYGIFNGANTMDLTFTQRFDNWDITARMPVFETDYSRSYGLAGGRFAWIWERFSLRATDSDFSGASGAQDTALYVNIMSQRMYGPFVGTGHDVYLGKSFSASAEVTAAALYDIVKERASYELGDKSSRSKRGREDYSIVPNVNGSFNVSWFPIENIQIRAGYDIFSFFNTWFMQQPVGFNAAAPDPAYDHRGVRIYHGFHVGISAAF